MLAHRIEATISDDRTLKLENLPFHSGEQVEIIILSRPREVPEQARYSLRGTVVRYVRPLESIAEDDWEATQ